MKARLPLNRFGSIAGMMANECLRSCCWRVCWLDQVTEDDLAKYFGLLGEVNNVIMLRDKFTSRHKVQHYVNAPRQNDYKICEIVQLSTQEKSYRVRFVF